MQEKIENWTKANQDKVLHAIGGYITYCIVRIISGVFLPKNVSIIFACIAVVLVAVGKEVIIDKLIRKKEIDWWDTVATILGAVPFIMTDLVND